MLSSSESDGGGFKDAILEVKGIGASKELVCQRNQCTKGIGAYDALRWESGVYHVQRVPVMEASGCEHCSGS